MNSQQEIALIIDIFSKFRGPIPSSVKEELVSVLDKINSLRSQVEEVDKSSMRAIFKFCSNLSNGGIQNSPRHVSNLAFDWGSMIKKKSYELKQMLGFTWGSLSWDERKGLIEELKIDKKNLDEYESLSKPSSSQEQSRRIDLLWNIFEENLDEQKFAEAYNGSYAGNAWSDLIPDDYSSLESSVRHYFGSSDIRVMVDGSEMSLRMAYQKAKQARDNIIYRNSVRLEISNLVIVKETLENMVDDYKFIQYLLRKIKNGIEINDLADSLISDLRDSK